MRLPLITLDAADYLNEMLPITVNGNRALRLYFILAGIQ